MGCGPYPVEIAGVFLPTDGYHRHPGLKSDQFGHSFDQGVVAFVRADVADVHHQRIITAKPQFGPNSRGLFRRNSNRHPVADHPGHRTRIAGQTLRHRLGHGGDRPVATVGKPIQRAGRFPIRGGQVVLGVHHRDRRNQAGDHAGCRQMGVHQCRTARTDQSSQPNNRRKCRPFPPTDTLHRHPEGFEIRNQLILPRQLVGNPVVEALTVPHSSSFGDQLLGAADPQPFDEHQDGRAFGHGSVIPPPRRRPSARTGLARTVSRLSSRAPHGSGRPKPGRAARPPAVPRRRSVRSGSGPPPARPVP